MKSLQTKRNIALIKDWDAGYEFFGAEALHPVILIYSVPKDMCGVYTLCPIVPHTIVPSLTEFTVLITTTW